MSQTVLIETSVISYLNSNLSRNLVTAAYQQITQDWWNEKRLDFRCFISEYILHEISRGNPEQVEKRLKSVEGLEILEGNQEIIDLAGIYLEKLDIPERSQLDAFHIAIGSYFRIDYILSWNFKHIANARISRKLQELNQELRIKSPILCSPSELME